VTAQRRVAACPSALSTVTSHSARIASVGVAQVIAAGASESGAQKSPHTVAEAPSRKCDLGARVDMCNEGIRLSVRIVAASHPLARVCEDNG